MQKFLNAVCVTLSLTCGFLALACFAAACYQPGAGDYIVSGVLMLAATYFWSEGIMTT